VGFHPLFICAVNTRINDITGVILAGGQSRRMGSDKRFVRIGEQTLLEGTISVCEQVFTEVLIVVGSPHRELPNLSPRVVTDLIPNCGSLGGLYTGLSYASCPHVFVVACDMPFLDAVVIRRFVALDRHADLLMVRLAQGLQPMHAVYSKACLPYLKRMIESGILKIQSLAEERGLAVHVVSEEAMRSISPQLLSFLNVNTPGDLEFARKLLREQGTESEAGKCTRRAPF
jgi:molybdopterin-guanine dinucleotide biosynthesis protein A